MNVATFVIGSAWGAKSVIARLTQLAAKLTFAPGRQYVVTVERIDPRGTPAQMAKIRAVIGELAEFSGHEPEELYEIMLGEFAGLEDLHLGNGKVMHRPRERVSEMSTLRRSEYIDWLQHKAVEMGVELRR